MVENEICRSRKIKPIVKGLIEDGTLKRKIFPFSDVKILFEYYTLRSNMRGEGESACMAVAKFEKDIISSNNLKDIKEYCIENSILYLTTIDVLCIAYYKGKMKETEINKFLDLNLNYAIPSKIPFKTFQSFLRTNPPIASIFSQSA